MLTIHQKVAREKFNELGNQVAEDLDSYIIQGDQLQKVVDHAIKLLCNNPEMKPERIARKTAHHFRLKVKPADWTPDEDLNPDDEDDDFPPID